MDPCFNKLIPPSREKIHIIRPSSKTFVTGLASQFDSQSYDSKILGPFIS